MKEGGTSLHKTFWEINLVFKGLMGMRLQDIWSNEIASLQHLWPSDQESLPSIPA